MYGHESCIPGVWRLEKLQWSPKQPNETEMEKAI